MLDIRLETKKAFEGLTDEQKKHIGPDAAAVVRTAFRLRTKDGLQDDAISRALKHHDIDKRSRRDQEAYRHLLVKVFLFGTEAQEAAAERKRTRKEFGNA